MCLYEESLKQGDLEPLNTCILSRHHADLSSAVGPFPRKGLP